jgi:hypothetical protein
MHIMASTLMEELARGYMAAALHTLSQVQPYVGA